MIFHPCLLAHRVTLTSNGSGPVRLQLRLDLAGLAGAVAEEEASASQGKGGLQVQSVIGPFGLAPCQQVASYHDHAEGKRNLRARQAA